jgi:hypothetical protein
MGLDFVSIDLPPFETCKVCRNLMSEMCVEYCAKRKDYSFFELKKGLSIQDLPPFPLREWEEMSKQVKSKVIAIYLAQITGYLQGVENGSFNDRPGSSPIFKNVEIKNLLPDPNPGTPSHQGGEECQDPAKRTD